jgi:peptide/nickel transport system permease protein
MLYGARVSLMVAFVSVAISLVLGVTIGLLAGYYQGWLDSLLMRFVEAQLAFPFILLALTVLAALGSGLLQLILVLGVGRWDVFARVVRGETRALMERQHIEASKALGSGAWRVMLRHLLPNLLNTVVVVASFSVATNILTESALSFLGLGVDVSIPTWGSMLAEGRDYMRSAWWLTTLPGAAIMLTVLSINAVGDWLRDVLDPRMVE